MEYLCKFLIRWVPGYWLYTVWYYFALYFILHRHILVNAYGNRRLHKNTHTYTDTPMCVDVSMVYTCTHHGGTRTHHIFAYIVYICATDQLEKKKLFIYFTFCKGKRVQKFDCNRTYPKTRRTFNIFNTREFRTFDIRAMFNFWTLRITLNTRPFDCDKKKKIESFLSYIKTDWLNRSKVRQSIG